MLPPELRGLRLLLENRQCGHDSSPPCAGRTRVVVVPTVLKGLNNQRMRIVSDIVGAMLIGAAVQLPMKLAARRSCHFRFECYKQYEPVLQVWDIFEEHATLRALKEAGACIIPPAKKAALGISSVYINDGNKSDMTPHSRTPAGAALRPLRTPIAASRLGHLANTMRLVNDAGDPLQRLSFGGRDDCCVLFVPDTDRARTLFRIVNAAFRTATPLSSIARAALSRFYSVASGRAMTLALHWRAETDMTGSAHALNRSDYVRGVKQALAKQHSDRSQGSGRLHCILLGDQNAAETRAIAGELGDPFWLTLYSKATLMGAGLRVRVPKRLVNLDDAVGMIDFEIGTQADVFIGAPFSSFSVMIALVRSKFDHGLSHTGSGRLPTQNRATLMATGADTKDQLGAIFDAAYPFRTVVPADPCSSLIRAHPAYSTRAGLTSCPSLGHADAGPVMQMIPIRHCTDCGIEWCGSPTAIPLMEKRFRRWKNCALRGTLPIQHKQMAWNGCESLDAATATQELLRNPATQEMFYLSPVLESQASLYRPRLAGLIVQLEIAEQVHRGAPGQQDTCSHIAPNFVFEPPLDHALSCQLVVVTATFGTRDTIGRIDTQDADRLAKFEQESEINSCWFALVDKEAFDSLQSIHNDVPEAPISNPWNQTSRRLYQVVRWGVWNVVVLSKAMLPFKDAKRNSRLPKMLLHRLFGSATYALYMDSKLRFKKKSSRGKLWHFVSDQFDVPLNNAVSSPAWVSPKHMSRESVYAEADCIVKLGLVPLDIIQRQLDDYLAAKFPSVPLHAGGPGLIEGEWHLRNLNSVDQARIGCAWMQEFTKRGHTRDQLSFNYVVWKLGLLPTQNGSRTRLIDYRSGGKVFYHAESYERKKEKIDGRRNNSKTICGARRDANRKKKIGRSPKKKPGENHKERIDGSLEQKPGRIDGSLKKKPGENHKDRMTGHGKRIQGRIAWRGLTGH